MRRVCLFALVFAAIFSVGIQTAAAFGLSADEEILLGQKLAPLAFDRGGGSGNLHPGFRRSIMEVFSDLAAQASLQRRLPYNLTILASTEPDAWSYPGGSAYITRGLLQSLRSYDELAAVLAHQIAHQVLGHNLKYIESASGWQLLKDVIAGRVAPTKGNLGKYAITVLGLAYPREAETAADRMAKTLANRAGYNGGELSSAYGHIAAFAGRRCAFFATHPHSGIIPLADDEPALEVVFSGEVDTSADGQSAVATAEPLLPGVDVDVSIGAGMGFLPLSYSGGAADLSYFDGADEYQLSVITNEVQPTGGLCLEGRLGILGFTGFVQIARLRADFFTNGQTTGLHPVTLGFGRQLQADRLTLEMGGFYSAVEVAETVGTVSPVGDSTGIPFMQVGEHLIEHGKPVKGVLSAQGLGGYVRGQLELSENLFVFGQAARQWSAGDKLEFAASDRFGDKVVIPFAGNDLNPVSFSGWRFSAGVLWRF